MAPAVVRAVQEAAVHGLSFGAPTEMEIDMAETLVRRSTFDRELYAVGDRDLPRRRREVGEDRLDLRLGDRARNKVGLEFLALRLLDDANFALYESGKKHRYYGGLAKSSPVSIVAPPAGHWHVVVDLGGYAGTVRASARVHQGA